MMTRHHRENVRLVDHPEDHSGDIDALFVIISKGGTRDHHLDLLKRHVSDNLVSASNAISDALSDGGRFISTRKKFPSRIAELLGELSFLASSSAFVVKVV